MSTGRQYCFGLLGLISAVLMLGWSLSYKATPNDPTPMTKHTQLNETNCASPQ